MIGECHPQAWHAGEDEYPGVNAPRAKAIDQHSHADARRNGQRQIAKQQDLRLFLRQVQDSGDRAAEGAEVVPDDECQKEGHPREVEHAPATRHAQFRTQFLFVCGLH